MFFDRLNKIVLPFWSIKQSLCYLFDRSNKFVLCVNVLFLIDQKCAMIVCVFDGFLIDQKRLCYVCMFCFSFRCLFVVHLFRNIVVQAFARNVRKAEECKTLHPSFLWQIGGSEPAWANSENSLHWVYLGFQINSVCVLRQPSGGENLSFLPMHQYNFHGLAARGDREDPILDSPANKRSRSALAPSFAESTRSLPNVRHQLPSVQPNFLFREIM